MSRASETQHHGDEFVARNAWLHLLLGLESWALRFDALLDAHAPASAPPTSPGEDATDARLIDFVLGLAAMRATLRRHLAAAAGEGRPASGVATTRSPAGSEWLR